MTARTAARGMIDSHEVNVVVTRWLNMWLPVEAGTRAPDFMGSPVAMTGLAHELMARGFYVALKGDPNGTVECRLTRSKTQKLVALAWGDSFCRALALAAFTLARQERSLIVDDTIITR